MKRLVLVLDDEPNVRADLAKRIEGAGYEVRAAATLSEANRLIQAESIDFAIVDLKIEYGSEYGGIEAISKVNKAQPAAKVMVLTAYEMTPDLQEQLAKVHTESFVSKGGQKNYIAAVVDELLKMKETTPSKNCFVIMPFSDTPTCTSNEWTEIFETMIKLAVERSGYNYQCYRACLDVGNIIEDILINLNGADLVIADLTDRNPNVFYELGVRHALRDSTVLITQCIDDVPFDLRHFALVLYDWKTRRGRENFCATIRRILKLVEQKPHDVNLTSPVLKYLRTFEHHKATIAHNE